MSHIATKAARWDQAAILPKVGSMKLTKKETEFIKSQGVARLATVSGAALEPNESVILEFTPEKKFGCGFN